MSNDTVIIPSKKKIFNPRLLFWLLGSGGILIFFLIIFLVLVLPKKEEINNNLNKNLKKVEDNAIVKIEEKEKEEEPSFLSTSSLSSSSSSLGSSYEKFQEEEFSQQTFSEFSSEINNTWEELQNPQFSFDDEKDCAEMLQRDLSSTVSATAVAKTTTAKAAQISSSLFPCSAKSSNLSGSSHSRRQSLYPSGFVKMVKSNLSSKPKLTTVSSIGRVGAEATFFRNIKLVNSIVKECFIDYFGPDEFDRVIKIGGEGNLNLMKVFVNYFLRKYPKHKFFNLENEDEKNNFNVVFLLPSERGIKKGIIDSLDKIRRFNQSREEELSSERKRRDDILNRRDAKRKNPLIRSVAVYDNNNNNKRRSSSCVEFKKESLEVREKLGRLEELIKKEEKIFKTNACFLIRKIRRLSEMLEKAFTERDDDERKCIMMTLTFAYKLYCGLRRETFLAGVNDEMRKNMFTFTFISKKPNACYKLFFYDELRKITGE